MTQAQAEEIANRIIDDGLWFEPTNPGVDTDMLRELLVMELKPLRMPKKARAHDAK